MDAPELIVTNSQGTAIVTEQVRHPRDVTYIRSDLLIDPNAVHMNMLRGTLAKPSVDQIVHIYGPEALAASPEVAKLVADAAVAQCCMCGKTELSTAEDGGPECQLDDGRWVCSRDCWDFALAPDAGTDELAKLRDGIGRINDKAFMNAGNFARYVREECAALLPVARDGMEG